MQNQVSVLAFLFYKCKAHNIRIHEEGLGILWGDDGGYHKTELVHCTRSFEGTVQNAAALQQQPTAPDNALQLAKGARYVNGVLSRKQVWDLLFP